MHGPITSVHDADAVRYERREAEKRGGGQEGHQGHQGHQESGGHDGPAGHDGRDGPAGHDGLFWYTDWRGDASGASGPMGPRGPVGLRGPLGPRGQRRSAACRVNLSAAFEAIGDGEFEAFAFEAVEAGERSEEERSERSERSEEEEEQGAFARMDS